MNDKAKPRGRDSSLPMVVLGKTLQRMGEKYNDPHLTALGQRTEQKGLALREGSEPLTQNQDDPPKP